MRHSVAGLLQYRSRFNARPVHVGSMLDKVALVQLSSNYFDTPVSHSNSVPVTYYQHYMILAINSVIKQGTSRNSRLMHTLVKRVNRKHRNFKWLKKPTLTVTKVLHPARPQITKEAGSSGTVATDKYPVTLQYIPEDHNMSCVSQ
jgi:hypothetical protein